MTLRHHLALALLLSASLFGCASFPSPVDQLATAQAAVRTAEEAGADRLDPQAQLYLKLAKESLDKGKARMEADEHETADRLLRKAEADAELARAIARSVSARAEAEEAKKTVGKIKTVQ